MGQAVQKRILPMGAYLGRVVLALPLAASLAGCTLTYPAVGAFEDYHESFVGTVRTSLLTGGGILTLRTESRSINCTGIAQPPSIIPLSLGCAGQAGFASLTCDDGRRLTAQWVADSCTRGHGTGQDQNGAMASFVFGANLNQEEALRIARASLRERDAKPELPVYAPRDVRAKTGYATGTAFAVTDDGVFATNYHVVDGAKEVMLFVGNSPGALAQILISDEHNDITLLRASGIKAHPLGIAPISIAEKGTEVMHLGYPLVQIPDRSIRTRALWASRKPRTIPTFLVVLAEEVTHWIRPHERGD